MQFIAQGSFSVQMTPAGEPRLEGGVALGRVKLVKQFEGDFIGQGEGEMLSALTPQPGSAGYVAIERVSGRLLGREGSFVMQHSGRMDRGDKQLSIQIVPDSGTGELVGIHGDFLLRIEGKQHFYTLRYRLQPK